MACRGKLVYAIAARYKVDSLCIYCTFNITSTKCRMIQIKNYDLFAGSVEDRRERVCYGLGP